MTDINAVLRAVLIADPAIAAIVGTRVYPDQRPQLPTLPCVEMRTVDTVVDEHLAGISGMETPRIQFDCYATTRLAANSLAHACMVLLAAIQQQSTGGLWIEGVSVSGGLRHSDINDPDGGEEWIYIAGFDLRVTYQTV